MRKRILTNTHIYPLCINQPEINSILIQNGIIQALGAADEIIPQYQSSALVEDLDQSILMPSFTDSHIHLLSYGLSLLRVNCETKNKRDCLDRIACRLIITPPGKWVIGHGWNHNIWAKGYGSKEDLDMLSDKHPIYLTHKSLHCGWANSIALNLAGITLSTPNPARGTIQRDASGEPTGIVLESAMQLIESVIPTPTTVERESAVLEAQRALLKFGITTVHDFDCWTLYGILNKLINENTLTLRVSKSIPEPYLDEAIENKKISGRGNNHLKIGWLKLFADGALGPQTAAMLTPYENSHSAGMLFLLQKDIQKYGERALPNGIAMAVHAIGDRANRETLLALSQLDKQGLLKIPALNSRIEHVQLISNDDLHLFSKHKVIASMQPIHAASDMEMAKKYWGTRCGQSYAWNSILQAGAQLIFGSDAPVESPNPFIGIHATVLRKHLGKKSRGEICWIPDQCLSVQDSINAYTSAPSIASGFGRITGKIQIGFAADLVLLPRNFLNINSYDIQFTSPLATMIDGKWVYRNDNINIEIQ